jgi:very-short-patch-repair endonuclease
LSTLTRAIEAGLVAPGQGREAFETAYARWWIGALVDADDVLRTFVPAEHERRIEEFRRLDERFAVLTKSYIRAALCAGLPNQDAIGAGPEWGVLRREMEKKRNHLPLRQLIGSLPTALTKLSPCLLMSPLSVAQYLPAAAKPFDLVVFDEASQIPVWDAIGCLARGKQAVIVGDPKQLPPTSFFARADEEAADETVTESDLESILDECLGAGVPRLGLSWHYRSRHETLIAFSNHRYYQGRLVTFPSPVTEDRAVRLRYVPDGVYEKGGARINKPEAMALVADLIGRLKDPAFLAAGHTIGVVTFNAEQQRLIEDLLDDARRKDPSIEPHFAEDRLEPVFVKNLESVQGDERDLMYFSMTYGPDRTEHVSMNFGPMNRDGGERRLNVAITRARNELSVFSSLRPEQIDLSRTQAIGVRDLKHFLEFAERGPRALAEAVVGSVGDFESPFEAAVASRLAERGWQVHPQVGISAFRIDLGVVHPDMPGRFLAGIECDGATYHRSATARDRDKLREQVLRGLGWEIVRIWSTDWWIDADDALEKTEGRLRAILEASRAARPAEPVLPDSAADLGQDEEVSAGAEMLEPEGSPLAEILSADDMPPPPEVIRVPELELVYAEQALPVSRAGNGFAMFREADPASVVPAVNPEAFADPSYTPTLQAMIRHVVETEAPVRDDVLVRRIARAHGFQRAGARIRQRVLELTKLEFTTTDDDEGSFFWAAGTDAETWSVFRHSGGGEPRPADEIALPELAILARAVQAQGFRDEDAIFAMAREIGLRRLHAATRQRLEKAWHLALQSDPDLGERTR